MATSDELVDAMMRIRKQARDAGAPMFAGIPDAWFEAHRFRCEQGHVFGFVILTDDGDRCPVCSSRCLMTYPDDKDGELVSPYGG